MGRDEEDGMAPRRADDVRLCRAGSWRATLPRAALLVLILLAACYGHDRNDATAVFCSSCAAPFPDVTTQAMHWTAGEEKRRQDGKTKGDPRGSTKQGQAGRSAEKLAAYQH